MNETIRTFVLIPADRCRRTLRRYRVAVDEGSEHQHDTSVTIEPELPCMLPDDCFGAANDIWPHNDPRWPRACACGELFTDDDEWLHSIHRLMRRRDTRELITLAEAPVGAVWNAPWLAAMPSRVGADGCSFVVRTPAGDWQIDAPTRDGFRWTRSGEMHRLTVKPSFKLGDYHAILADGELIPV